MKEKSWACTLITQLSLCLLGYIAMNIGQPQKLTSHGNGGPNHMYFLCVRGGFRSVEEQSLLLPQMAKVVKTYNARFIVAFSELGESDPLLQNATKFPELRNMPWYTAGALGRLGETYYLKKIKTPYGQTLDIISLDTVILQDQSSLRVNNQISWLTRTLNESNSDWKIVVGLHQLIPFDYTIINTKKTPFQHLHNILLQYGVDAYISMKTSAGKIRGGGMGSPGTGLMDKGPHITAINQNLKFIGETVDGFLLHRVNSLEMVTFVVKFTGEVEHRLSFQQKGRATM